METSTPDVIVLGMPSSGKTVFLSVLGHTFMLAADARRPAPLGFRMIPADDATRDMTSLNMSDLENGNWPQSTRAGVINPLAWDVATGFKKVFRLSSMDISGETVRTAFAGGDAPSPTSHSSHADDALLSGTESPSRSRDNSQAPAGTAESRLRDAVDKAKVVCFFVNIALPPEGEQRRNFREAISRCCSLLNNHPSLRKKTLVVLTQSHLRHHTIDRAGGAKAYLEKITPDLHQVASEYDIPVIAVSAVNEVDDNNHVPKKIESEGLFDFLLMVAGAVSPDSFGPLKDAFLKYLEAKTRYSQKPERPIPERIPLIKSLSDAGAAFHQTCLAYLDHSSNFIGDDGRGIDEATLADYRASTEEAPVLQEALHGWTDRRKVDEAWLRHLDEAVDHKLRDGTPFSLDTMIGDLAKEFTDSNSGLSPQDFFLFGFDEQEDDEAVPIPSYKDWVTKNLEAVEKRHLEDWAKQQDEEARKIEKDRIAKEHEERVRKAKKALGRQKLRLRACTLAVRFAFVLALCCTCSYLSAIEWDWHQPLAYALILLSGALGLHTLFQMLTISVNRSRLSEIAKSVEEGNYQSALAVANRFTNHPLLLVFKKDFLTEGFVERLTDMGPLAPLFLKNQELFSNLAATIQTATQEGLLPSSEPDTAPLTKGEERLHSMQAKGELTPLPSYEQLRDNLVDIPGLKGKFADWGEELEPITKSAQQNLDSLLHSKDSWQNAQNKQARLLKLLDRLREINRIVSEEALAQFDAEHVFEAANRCLEKTVAAEADKEISDFAKLRRENARIDSILEQLDHLLEEVAAIVEKAEQALIGAREEKDWRQFNERIPALQKRLQKEKDAVDSTAPKALSEKAAHAKICEEIALQIQELATTFLNHNPTSPHRQSVEQIDQKAKGTVMALPKLVRIDAILRQNSSPANIKETTVIRWMLLPTMQNAVNPESNVGSIYMEIPAEGPKSSYQLPVSVDWGPEQEITISTQGLKHGLNVIQKQF